MNAESPIVIGDDELPTTSAVAQDRHPTLRIRATRGWAALNLRELWNYRDLLWILVERDIKLLYKQTRRQQSRSQFPTCFESLFSAIAHSAGPHARRPRRFRGHVRRPSHRDVDLRVFADAAVSRDPRFPPADDFYRQEFSLGNAEDLAEVKSLSAHATVPFGSFNNCLKTLESSSLAPGDLEHKFYAAGVCNLLTVDLATGEREELVKIATE